MEGQAESKMPGCGQWKNQIANAEAHTTGQRATPSPSRSSARTTPSPSPTSSTAPASCTRTSRSTRCGPSTGSASARSLRTRCGGYCRWCVPLPLLPGRDQVPAVKMGEDKRRRRALMLTELPTGRHSRPEAAPRTTADPAHSCDESDSGCRGIIEPGVSSAWVAMRRVGWERGSPTVYQDCCIKHLGGVQMYF